jgi:hypothetical protein
MTNDVGSPGEQLAGTVFRGTQAAVDATARSSDASVEFALATEDVISGVHGTQVSPRSAVNSRGPTARGTGWQFYRGPLAPGYFKRNVLSKNEA